MWERERERERSGKMWKAGFIKERMKDNGIWKLITG